MDYADDQLYSDLGAEAIAEWHVWNDRAGRLLYHEDGFLVLTSKPLQPGAVEKQSYDLLTAAGWPLERIDSKSVAERFPLWNSDHYIDGYFNPRGGWAEAAETVSFMAAEAATAGIEICVRFPGRVGRFGVRTGRWTTGHRWVRSPRGLRSRGSWGMDAPVGCPRWRA